MKHSAPESKTNEPTKKKLNWCIGCSAEYPDEKYTKVAMRCFNCADGISYKFGLKKGYANLAAMETNIPWYIRKVPALENFDYRSQCRILAVAHGSDGVLNITQEEQGMAIKVKETVPPKYRLSDREEPLQVLKRIEKQTEVW